MDSLQNILTDALTTVGRFTNRNEHFCKPYSLVYLQSVDEQPIRI